MEDIPHNNNVWPWICADVGALENYGKTDSNRDRRSSPSAIQENARSL
jgi:hypothetical protein